MAELEFTTDELQSEEWRAVPGFENYYEVSSLCRVRRIKAGCGARVGHFLKPVTASRSPRVALCTPTKVKSFPVSWLRRLAFGLIVEANTFQGCWRDVPGYEGHYKVSDNGRVISIKRHTIRGCEFLKPYLDKQGYENVKLAKHNTKKRFFVHALVMLAFVGPYPPGLIINHKNAIKTCNHLWNLEYVTQSENFTHATGLGLYRRGDQHGLRLHPEAAARGSRNGTSRLTEADIPIIRTMHASGETGAAIARHFSVSDSTISMILSGRHWRHIPIRE